MLMLSTGQAKNIAAAIFVPPVLGIAPGFLPPVPIVDTEWGIMWKMPVALIVGFVFLLRVFGLKVLLVCWIYFFVMFWIVLYSDLFVWNKLYGTFP